MSQLGQILNLSKSNSYYQIKMEARANTGFSVIKGTIVQDVADNKHNVRQLQNLAQ